MGILLEYEHKKQQVGANFETDYKVITTCAPDCPACAVREQLHVVVKWLSRHKYQFSDGEGVYLMPQDWLELCREAGVEK